MPKTALEQWDETAGNNTDIDSINIDEGCAPSGMNNAARATMAQIAKWIGDDTLASAATTDLGSVPGRYINITGTTTITAFGTIKAGTIKYLKFAGALTLTHNATSLILPGAANITTAAGDTAIFASEGSGNWRCISYQRAVGAGWVSLASYTISNQAQLDIPIPTNATVFRIWVDSFTPVTDAQNLRLRTSTDAGVSFDSGASDYRFSQVRSTVGGAVAEQGSNSTDSIVLSSGVGNAAGETASGVITIFNPGLGQRCSLIYQFEGVDNNGAGFSASGGGARRATTDVDAVRLFCASGNLNSGRVYAEYKTV